MSNIFEMVLFILSVITVILLYRKSVEEEPYLLLKLFGYMVLGAFMFDFNSIKIPLGFVVFLLFFRNIPVNTLVKKRAAYVGLVVFLLSVILPFIETKLYEWPRKVELQNTNFFSGSMEEELENIKEELEITNDIGVKITNFRTVFSSEGKYKKLQMSLIDEGQPYRIHYSLNLLDDGKTIEVKRNRIEETHWEGSPYMDTNFLLPYIDLFTKPMFNNQKIKYYELRTDGLRTGYAIEDQAKYSIDTSGKKKIKDTQLPVEGILVDVCGTSTLDSYGDILGCAINEHYILDMVEREEEITESSILNVARRNSSEIDQWLNEHIGNHIGREINGEYVLTKDGVGTKVTEDEYTKALKETPIVDITFNEESNIWQVEVENPYANEPHIMEFKLNGETREITELKFR